MNNVGKSSPVWRAGYVRGRKRLGAAGFTLIELMIAVLVIAVLMGIAYPSYQNHVIKTRRAAATACMLEAAQFMERFYTTNLRYDTDAGGTAVALPAMQCASDIAIHYTIQLAAGTTATSYAIEGVPEGQQASKDTHCGTLSINQAGTKSVSTSGTSVGECW
ncbi:type IV pilin protein [Lysobacter sp. F60174L2]|uniref:type IV pilin protein n=1 Tax=Lysobacter sp. F60174L2 TaxID=3459295 RepID=UPI00403E1818